MAATTHPLRNAVMIQSWQKRCRHCRCGKKTIVSLPTSQNLKQVSTLQTQGMHAKTCTLCSCLTANSAHAKKISESKMAAACTDLFCSERVLHKIQADWAHQLAAERSRRDGYDAAVCNHFMWLPVELIQTQICGGRKRAAC